MTRKTQRNHRTFFIAALGLAPPRLPLEQVQITETHQLIGRSGLRHRR
jgi:hypothetical protein